MKRSTQVLFLFIAAVLLFGGIADMCIQFLNGEEMRWRIPVVLIGLGVGIPLFIVPFYEPAQAGPAPEHGDDDYSEDPSDSVGFMSSLGGDSGNGQSETPSRDDID